MLRRNIRYKHALRNEFERKKLEVINDIVTPLTRSTTEKLGGLQKVVDLLRELGGYEDIKIVEGYNQKLEALTNVLKNIPHDAVVIIGRSGLDHTHAKTPLWKVLEKHAKRGTLFWLNTKRESEVSWERPTDPNSKIMHAALNQLAMELANLARQTGKRRLRVVVFDDVIRSGRTMVNLVKTLRRYALENQVNVEAIPVAVMLNPASFLFQQSLLKESQVKELYKKNLAKPFWEAVVFKALGISSGESVKSVKQQLRRAGISEELIAQVANAIKEWGMLPPIAAHLTTTPYLNPLSHEISDITESLLEKEKLSEKEAEAVYFFSQILSKRANELSPHRESVKRAAILLPRTRPQ